MSELRVVPWRVKVTHRCAGHRRKSTVGVVTFDYDRALNLGRGFSLVAGPMGASTLEDLWPTPVEDREGTSVPLRAEGDGPAEYKYRWTCPTRTCWADLGFTLPAGRYDPPTAFARVMLDLAAGGDSSVELLDLVARVSKQ